MNRLIKDKLTEYLEFDSELLFNNTDYLVIFGGAIRDIIADKSIKNITDIDILCLSMSRDKAIRIVEENGYKYVDLQRPELYEMYRHIHHIFEPKTFIKGHKIIQFITPAIIEMPRPYHETKLGNAQKNSFSYLLSNVDLITSGVFYDGYNVYESIKGSISFIENKYTYTLPNNAMYDEKRINHRLFKLEIKGYKDINKFEWRVRSITGDNIPISRIVKMHQLKYKYPQIEQFKLGLELL